MYFITEEWIPVIAALTLIKAVEGSILLKLMKTLFIILVQHGSPVPDGSLKFITWVCCWANI